MTRFLAFLAFAALTACVLWQARVGAPEMKLPELGGWRWPEEHVECVSYVVGVGDTLWSIAGRYYPNRRTDEIVWVIRQVNELTEPEGPRIRPGQVLWIPDPQKYGFKRP